MKKITKLNILLRMDRLAHYDGLMKAMDKNSREILSETEDLSKNYKEELNSEK